MEYQRFRVGTAHPRACGENNVIAGRGSGATGSSPRVRGKRAPGALQGRGVRLIPARAGKTSRAAADRCGPPAHPRACGENVRGCDSLRLQRGSSPRVRGKRPGGGVGTVRPRLIPARAGKTPYLPGKATATPAHPRACGENSSWRRRSAAAWGSSPRVRGKLAVTVRAASAARLIPARAGKTSARRSTSRATRAHPRACGENATSPADHAQGHGSSPRVRGKLPRVRNRRVDRGLIPARAGKTASRCASYRAARAHPRACGENADPYDPATWWRGSSPRVRGKRRRSGPGRRGSGLIPARAGKTGWRSSRPSATRAHPRACGENARRSGGW